MYTNYYNFSIVFNYHKLSISKCRPFEKASADYAMPVDLYIGGIEHGVQIY